MSSLAIAEAKKTGVQRGYERPGTTAILASNFDLSQADVESVINRLEETVFRRLLKSSSGAEFKTRRNLLFGRYAALASGLGEMLAEMAEERQVEVDNSDLISLIRHSHVIPWPVGAKDEAVFCIETLDRAMWLVSELVKIPCDHNDLEQDSALARECGLSTFWSRMHIDCVAAVLLRRILVTPSPEVLDELLAGMRLSVIAYAAARQGHALRSRSSELVEEEYPPGFDEETTRQDTGLVEAGAGV